MAENEIELCFILAKQTHKKCQQQTFGISKYGINLDVVYIIYLKCSKRVISILTVLHPNWHGISGDTRRHDLLKALFISF